MSMQHGPPDVGGLISLKVDNFPFETTSEDLRQIFDKYGEVRDCYMPRDRITGQSRGFGFIRYATEEEAEAAIAGCDDKEMGDRRLRVSVAQHARPPLPERGPPGPHDGYRGDNGYGERGGGAYGRGGGGYGGDYGGGGGRGFGGGYGGGGGPAHGGGDVRPGDWTCPSCGFNVFAAKRSCFKCGAPKPYSGNYGGEGYGGGYNGGGGFAGGYGGGGYGGGADYGGGRGYDYPPDRGRGYDGRGYDGRGYDDRGRAPDERAPRDRSRSRDRRDDDRRERRRGSSKGDRRRSRSD